MLCRLLNPAMKPISANNSKQQTEQTEQTPPYRSRLLWRRNPVKDSHIASWEGDKLEKLIGEYFEKCYDEDITPTMCDLAGVTGFESVTQMINYARRRGGTVMRNISRSFLAVAAAYEEEAANGNRNALSLLALVPQFDSKEPANQEPQRPFQPQQPINLNITGLRSSETAGAQLTAQEAYLQLIRNKSFEEVEPTKTEKVIDGEYAVIEIGDE